MGSYKSNLQAATAVYYRRMAVVQVPVTIKKDHIINWNNDPFFEDLWGNDFEDFRTSIWKKHEAMFSRFMTHQSSVRSSTAMQQVEEWLKSSDHSESLGRQHLSTSRQRWLALRDFFNDPDFLLPAEPIHTTDDDTKFEVTVDTHDFKPEEVEVKVKDNVVTIAAKHEENEDQVQPNSTKKSHMSKKLTHSYKLPSSCKTENVTSKLTSPGLVMVSAPKTAKAVSFKVPIEVKK